MEAPGQIVRGAAEGFDAAADGLRSIFVSREERERNPTPRVAENIDIGEAQSVTGSIVNDVSQFASGFIGANRVLRLAGWGSGISRGMAAGAVADFSVFRAHEERLSNLVEQYPQLSNPITQFLAADPNDGELEGRLKAALEGAVVGGAVEGLFAGLRALRAARNGDMEGAAALTEEAAKAAPPPRDPLVDETVAREMDEEAAAQGPRAADEAAPEGSPEAPRAADGAAPRADIEVEVTAAPVREPTYAPRVLVDETALREIVTQYQREAGFGQDRNLSGIRTDLVETNLDVNQMLSAIRVAVREQMDRVDPAGPVGTVQSLATVRAQANELAREAGADADLLFQKLAARADNDAALAAEVTTYRIFLTSVADNTEKFARALNDTTGSATQALGGRAVVAEQYRKHVELLANVSALYRGVQTNIARALNAMRLQVRGSADLMRGIQDIENHAARFLMANNTAGRVKLAKGGWARNTMAALVEYFINSILSGPKTQAVSFITNVATTVLQPFERMVAGALHGGSREEFIEGGLQYIALATNLRDAFRLAGRALRRGDPIIDPFRSTVEIQGQAAISAARMGLNGGIASSVVDFLGGLIRIPSRLLMTQDEFFKQLTYRARIQAGAWREASRSGLEWGSKEFAELVDRRMQGAFDAEGVAVHADALEASRNVTFTDDLAAQTWTGNRTLGETLHSATTNHPFLQLIMPFVRTPTNVARFFWNRTPGLNLLRSQFNNDIMGRNGVEAAARARAQMATGGLLWGAAVTYALEGDITGGGPSDPTLQRQLRSTGWQPYSFRIRNEDGSVTYRDYSRLDPFGLFFSVAADMTEASSFLTEREWGQVAGDMTVALARQLQNKTYVSGLVRAMGALAEPDRRGERFVNGLAGGFMPSFVNQALRDDPYMREVRSLADALKARMPGSVEMDPVRNILGEAVVNPVGYGPDWLSPIAQTTRPGGDQPMTREWRRTLQDGVHDEIARQLVHHNAALRPPAPVLQGEVDLREYQHPTTGRTAYDRYQTLVGEVTIQGMTLKESLADLIRSPEYREIATDGTFDHDGSRIDLIRRVIGFYRQAAEQQLREEMPNLAFDLLTAQERRARIKVQ